MVRNEFARLSPNGEVLHSARYAPESSKSGNIQALQNVILIRMYIFPNVEYP